MSTAAPHATPHATPAPPHLPGAALALRARWFDGRSSQPAAVRIVLRPTPAGAALAIYPEQDQSSGEPDSNSQALLVCPPRRIRWPAHVDPRRPPAHLLVDLAEHGSLEILDTTHWHAALQTAGWRPGLAQRMQHRWPVLAGVLVAAVVVLVLLQRLGTPWLATQLVRYVPLQWELALTETALQHLDSRQFKPSRLPPARQDALRARFDALVAQIPPSMQRYPGYAPRYALHFRSGIPANAFALPGGVVVVSDALVGLAQREALSDDALVGILAHELGHVVNRHGARKYAELGVLNLGLGLALGDLSSLINLGATAVSSFSYTLAHEREADCFALVLLQHAGISTLPTADFFDVAVRVFEGNAEHTTKSGGLGDLLATHPDTRERAAQFRQPELPRYCPANRPASRPINRPTSPPPPK